MYSCPVQNFEEWREKARNFLAADIHPQHVQWLDADAFSLFESRAILPHNKNNAVPAEFIPFAKVVACHADPAKWSLLYECLWRLTHSEKKLLGISTDPLIRKLDLMTKSVRRNAHKTKAFVRFREYKNDDGSSHYIAWHNPDHNVLPLVAGFFQRRFSVMQWTIMTPYCTTHWDGKELLFLPGVPVYEHPAEDNMEEIWQAYYRSTFNPARIKLKMMRQEMPVRHWKTLPETKIISSMLQQAEKRVEDMMKFMPQDKL